MSDTAIKIQSSRNEQSSSDKKSTLEKLKSKKPRQETVTLEVEGEQLELLFQAISYKDLDALQAKHPPTQKQRVDGASFNRNSFPPALIAACSVEPKFSEKDALEIWNSDDWSTGELNTLFDAVSALCMKGLDVPFTGTVSE
jgi:hypothetical protein